MALSTAADVLNRAGVVGDPRFEDVGLMTDSAGFYLFRPYPAGTRVAEIRTIDGRPAVRCYLSFVVEPPSEGKPVSPVHLRVWFSRRWHPNRTVSSHGDPYQPTPGDPAAPSADSYARLRSLPRPIDLDSTDADYLYDHREDLFLDEDGRILSPVQILDQMYALHCRTLRLGFRLRWKLGNAARWLIRNAVWKTQDAAMWALFTFYDVELVADKKDKWRFSSFHKYKPSDFRRITEAPNERSHFFGFQTSKKSFFTNLAVVVVVCLLLYWKGPRDGLLRTIYTNTALTTAALVFGFLLADTAGPWLLIRVICWLSRARDRVLFFVRKVNV
jgi:hypothetical protein